MANLLLGDCLAVLPTLEDNSIDAVVTDPPYFRMKGGGSAGAFEWWDLQWDDPRKFLEWLDSVAAHWERVLKPNGSLYCFASCQMAARVEVMLGDRFNVLNRITWNKGDLPAGRHKAVCKEELRAFFPASEAIIFCEHYGADNMAKGEAGYAAKCGELRGFIFEPLRAYLDGERERAGVKGSQIMDWFASHGFPRYVTVRHSFSASQWELPTEENYYRLRNCFSDLGKNQGEYLPRSYEDLRREYEDLRQEYEDLRRPFAVTADVPYTDVWTFPTVQHYPGKHPCEKPAALLEHIILSSARPGDIVLDCFAGSGATLTAAKRLGRQYVGIEIDPHWHSVALQRLGESAPLVFDGTRRGWLESQGIAAPLTGPHQPTLFDQGLP